MNSEKEALKMMRRAQERVGDRVTDCVMIRVGNRMFSTHERVFHHMHDRVWIEIFKEINNIYE